ncbi:MULTISPECIES: DNA primase [Bacillus]|uniref:DNA primase n=2 Tax=Bacillus TaxID=1386 RepID=A0AAJ3YZI6_9BACI|nr:MULTISPECIES: DNA primase [Bacillus]KKB74589.1 DNA primase [Bacillus sp. TH008]MDU0072182.1 DNA primase [Bacillus sp. IG6]MED8019759.1 DNA primase [Bacillus glycinifermentans]QAT66081.1 DNA primase [Bacillus glycinifermentans]WKB75787.1 DNA primase [Bacillus glycinifermentans]
MGNRIPDEIVEQVQKSADIVEVIGEYVQLRKQGRNYFGLCPFHGENTPSFSVSGEKQIFHCFGCGAGGNVFSFLRQIEGYSFSEAVTHLADKYHIDMPEHVTAVSSYSAGNSDEQKMAEAHELLKKFYHHLLVNTKEGQKALDYLLERGITMEEIERFEIGCALDSWDFITKFLERRGFEAGLMEKAGLIIRRENGDGYFDRFRNRIMFPIHDHHGTTVAFSGRTFTGEHPKYMNSPETPIFRKSKLLYHFHQARLHIRKEERAVLFEGFADVISAVGSGVKEAIATMGTALTEEHAKVIRRNVGEVILCYDSDQAGYEATLKAADMLQKRGCTVKVAMIPDGLDPDDYIKKFGGEKFKQDVIGSSVTIMTFKMHYFRKGKNLSDEGDRLAYINDVLKEVSQLSGPLEQEIYIKQLANEFALSLDSLKEQLSVFEKESAGRKRDGGRNELQERRTSVPRPPRKKTGLRPAHENAERMLIAHMIRDRDVIRKVLDRVGFEFNLDQHRAIAAYLYAMYEEGADISIQQLFKRIDDQELGQLLTDILMLQINEELSETELSDYVKKVLNYRNWSMIKEKEAARTEAERQKDFIKAATLAQEIIKLNRSLK